LESEKEQLVNQIADLPLHEPIPLTSKLGYHSVQRDSGDVTPSGYHSLTADLVFNEELRSIGFVPAFDPMNPQRDTYAFPKRFKIEVLEGSSRLVNGVWLKDPDGTEWTEVVNWLGEDFPNPGPYPVVFSDIDRNVSKVRITVPKSDNKSDTEYFALGELYLFRSQEGEIADNMSVFGSTGILFEASDSFKILPVWDLEYLYDGLSGLGLPLSEVTAEVEDLVVRFDKDSVLPEPVQIVLDLGEIKRIGRIELWPTEAPRNMAIPLFGFPGSVLAELSTGPDFVNAQKIESAEALSNMHNDRLLTLICEGFNARYIRLTFSSFSEFMGNPILGLGEISVLEFGKVFSVGCEISSSGLPAEYMDQLPRLVDGFSRQRRILPETDWIIGLAKRRPLDARLEVVEHELAVAREEWRSLLFRLSVLGGGVLVLLLLIGWGLQRRQRRRELNKLKVQITRDLHDEVGSSLGSISLTSEQLENMALDDDMKEELGELSLMAREANASLLEVVWFTDQETILLPALIGRLVERAEKVLRNVEVVSEISPDCPNIKVNLTAKRHVIMFFKEVIHNCARHSRATRVGISVHFNGGDLTLSIHDNGWGFEPEQKQEGWGLGSMKKRAEELGGNLEIVSGPTGGTKIKLEIPFINLSTGPTHPYKTSN
jgi:signal transduction histidine kinase